MDSIEPVKANDEAHPMLKINGNILPKKKTDAENITHDPNKRAKLNHAKLLLKFFIFHIVLVASDIATDIKTALDYYQNGHFYWSLATSLVILAPFGARLFIYFGTLVYNKFLAKPNSKTVLEPFSKVIWQFSLLHPFKNIRLFHSLLLIDTQLSSNFSLVSRIKGEAVSSGLYEAFLESAPQFVLQLSIVLRTGYITPFQMVSIPLSFFSLAYSSTKLFYSQRLGKYCQTDPQIKYMALVTPLIMLQNFGFLAIWVFITAYVREFTIPCVIFVMMSVHASLKTFIFGWKNRSKDKDERKMFWISVFTSWVSPSSVWSNNMSEKINRLRGSSKRTSRHFLITSSLTCTASTLICLGFMLVFVGKIRWPYNPNNSAPLTHCFHNASEVTSRDFIIFSKNIVGQFGVRPVYICQDEPCPSFVRLCNPGENSTDLLFSTVALYLIIFVLIGLLSSICLQLLGNYENIYRFTSRFGRDLVHPSLIQDQLHLLFLSRVLHKVHFKDQEEELHNLIKNVGPDVLNQPDPLTGDTCLHFAFQKGLFREVNLMIQNGGRISQKNKKGDSVMSLITPIVNQQDETNIHLSTKTSLENETFILKLNIRKDESGMQGRATITNNRNEIWRQVCLDEKNPFKIPIVICYLKEVEDYIESSDYYKELIESLEKFYLSQETEIDFKNLLENVNTKYECEIEQQVWKEPALHQALKNGDINGCYFLHNFLGVTLKAQDAKAETPLQTFINNIEDETSDLTVKRKSHLYWFATKKGAAEFAISEPQMDKMLELLKDHICKRNSLNGLKPTKIKNIFLHSALRGDAESLEKFLELKCEPETCNENKQTALHLATKSNRVDCLQLLLNMKADINSIDDKLQTPLHMSIKDKNYEASEFLINQKANVNTADVYLDTPLHSAARLGNSKLVQELVNNGANLNSLNENDQSPLHIAAKYGIYESVSFLAKQNSKLDILDKYGKSPLHYAISSETFPSVDALIVNGANVDLPDANGETPLHRAVRKRDTECIRRLIEGAANLNKVDKNNHTPLHLSAKLGLKECLKLLIEKNGLVNTTDVNGKTPLHLAIEAGNFNCTILLVENKANVNAIDGEHKTPLHLAAQAGNDDCVKLLLRNRADINACDSNNRTPLHLAAEKGNSNCVSQLIMNHANVNALGKGHESPLHLAASLGNLEFVKTLVENKADVNIINKNNETPLHLASSEGHHECVSYLLTKNANINSLDSNNETPLHKAVKSKDRSCVLVLIANGVHLNVQNFQGKTALHYAVSLGIVNFVEEFMIENKADPSIADQSKQTPIHLAVLMNDLKCLRSLITSPSAHKAFENGMQSPLHLAANLGHVECVRIMVDQKMVVNSTDEEGQTPLQVCTKLLKINDIDLCTRRQEIYKILDDGEDENDGFEMIYSDSAVSRSTFYVSLNA